MTIKELRNILKRYPADTLVLISALEDLYYRPPGITKLTVVKSKHYPRMYEYSARPTLATDAILLS